MNAKQTIAIIIPIAIFIIKKYISLYITIPVLITGCIITYYLYAKSDEDKYLRGALSLYGLNFFFIILGIMLYYML
ncbi:hypothetical protein [Methanobrevibacter intestini]|uniref:hypothetical protein n=1 Tax=Methanobrevibacter intestini TaxID=2911853 RepID=UPI003CEB44A0